MILYDSTTAADIPDDAEAVAGYIDGANGAWTAEDWARFADKPQAKITVTGEETADVCDVENGDLTVWQGARWAAVKVHAGYAAVIYTAESTEPAMVVALASVGLEYLDPASYPAPGAYRWRAHWTGEQHLEDGCLATQYASPSSGSGGHYDLSQTAPDWPPVPGAAPPPTPAPEPPTQVGDKMLHTVEVATDSSGDGWVQTSIPWSTFQAATLQGSDPPTDGYWPGSVKVQERDGNVLVSVTGFLPDSRVQVFVLASA